MQWAVSQLAGYIAYHAHVDAQSFKASYRDKGEGMSRAYTRIREKTEDYSYLECRKKAWKRIQQSVLGTQINECGLSFEVFLGFIFSLLLLCAARTTAVAILAHTWKGEKRGGGNGRESKFLYRTINNLYETFRASRTWISGTGEN